MIGWSDTAAICTTAVAAFEDATNRPRHRNEPECLPESLVEPLESRRSSLPSWSELEMLARRKGTAMTSFRLNGRFMGGVGFSAARGERVPNEGNAVRSALELRRLIISISVGIEVEDDVLVDLVTSEVLLEENDSLRSRSAARLVPLDSKHSPGISI
jgi:hypothetical protein